MKAPLKYRLQNFWFVLTHPNFWFVLNHTKSYEYDQLINKWMDEGFLKLEETSFFQNNIYVLTTDNKDLIWVENYPYGSGVEYTRGGKTHCSSMQYRCVYPITKYRLELYKHRLIHERNTRTN